MKEKLEKTVLYIVFGALIGMNSFCSIRNPEEVNTNTCFITNEIYTLEKQKDMYVSFDLDSITSPKTEYVKLKFISDTLYYTFLNSYKNSIYCYYYDSRKLKKIIKLTGDKRISAYEIITWDSILTYQYSSYKMILQNFEGEKIKEIEVSPEPHQNGYYSLPSSRSPLIYSNGSIHLAGGHMTDQKANNQSHSIAKINLSTFNVEYLLNFPEIYEDYFFGGAHYRMDVSYTYNEMHDFFVVNYPAHHKIVVTREFENIEEYCAGSKNVRNIPNYSYPNNSDNAFKFTSENGYYYSIIYDSYRDFYYRLCLLPSKKENGGRYSRDLSIIILDKDFQIVGEKIFKDGLDYELGSIESISVSPDGLLIPVANKTIDEDLIRYIPYKLTHLINSN